MAVQVDLLGEETVQMTSPETSGAPAYTNNQDLLRDMFGSSDIQSPASIVPQRSNVDDILGLFGSTAPAASTVTSSPPANDQFNLFTNKTTAPAPTTTAQTHAASSAYDKNGLKITLTPQTNAARPGMVNILARFHASTTAPVTGLNFQAAVPKVSQEECFYTMF